MRHTHAMEDAKRRAVEAIAQNRFLLDRSGTNEKTASRNLAANLLILWQLGGGDLGVMRASRAIVTT